jgi:hypothetical protein
MLQYLADDCGVLLGGPGTLDFDSLPPGTLLLSGSAQDGGTFTYAIGGLTLEVTDAFDTTSGQNSLGLTGGDGSLLDGDTITLAFPTPLHAMGLSVITSDPVLAGEIQLITSSGTALGSGVAETTLPDGGIVYFLGLVSADLFSAATLTFADDGEINFAFNVDDIIRAIPEPTTGILLSLGLVSFAILRRRHLSESMRSPRS